MTETTRSNPVHFPLHQGDMLTIQWSGEPRTVIVDADREGLILRDLTAEESAELAEMTGEGSPA